MNQDRCFFCMEKLPLPDAKCPSCGRNNQETAAAQPNHAMRCGTVLGGKYLLGRVLGRGGFGMTYLSLDMALDTRVCIKEYLPEGIALRDSRRSPTVFWTGSAKTDRLRFGRESFVREAQKAARVRDLRSVVKVWDVFQANDTAYIVMDYVEGETLKNHLIRTGIPLTEAECVERFGPIMDDLEQIHQRGIVHRDISPDNLMLNKNDQLILLDLGAAKDLSGGSGQSALVVTRRGFSPLEQYSQSGVIGPWTDVYALCATIVYCVTGRLIPEPLERYTGVELDLSGFTPAFAAVLEKGLAIEPDNRYQSTPKLLEALQAALTPAEEAEKKKDSAPLQDTKPESEALPETQTQQAEKKEKTDKKENNKSHLILSIAAAVALLAAGLILLFSQSAAIAGLFEIKKANSMLALTEELIDKGRLSSDKGNYAEALDCFLRAVETGNSGAMEDIRALYEEDRLTEEEQEALRSRLTASVEDGNAVAMTAIGDLYAYGLGMEVNADKARAWYAKAANAGDESALEAAAALETTEDLPEALSEAP